MATFVGQESLRVVSITKVNSISQSQANHVGAEQSRAQSYLPKLQVFRQWELLYEQDANLLWVSNADTSREQKLRFR